MREIEIMTNLTKLRFYDKEGNIARFTYATDRTPIQVALNAASGINGLNSADATVKIIKEVPANDCEEK
jgi:propanediol dehydratase large subunit